eukprot:s1116_g11.t3
MHPGQLKGEQQILPVTARCILVTDVIARGAVQPYCLCEVMGRDEPSFRTRAVDEGDSPTWDETEMVIEEACFKMCIKMPHFLDGTFTCFLQLSHVDDGTEDDLIGWAKLEYDKMVPSGFVGTIFRNMRGRRAGRKPNTIESVPAMAAKDAPNECCSTAESEDIRSLVELRRHAQACHHRCLVAVLGCDAAARPRLCAQVMEMATGGLPTLVCSHKGGILPKDAMVVEWPFADHDHNCLGGTFGACVFFDVPMASPETLWSACETVQGGGVVCLVLPPELTETKCCALQEEAANIVPNADQKLGEALLPRIVQSLWQMPVCGFVDASLTLLSTKQIGLSAKLTPPSLGPQTSPEAPDALLELCCTACQRKAFMRLQASLVAVGQAKGRQTVLSLTGRRGRGKSSVAGLFVAAALQCGRNVVVTGPARNSVQGIFRFAARAMGLPAPEVSCSTLCHARARYLPAEGIPGFASALALVNDAPVLVVDEMASLPIPQLHQLLVAPAPLILLLGTLSGAEGTGAAVEEKVFKELSADSAEVCRHATLPDGVSEREFVKLCLQEAVRYKPEDPVEAWLDPLLFLAQAPFFEAQVS